MFDMCEVLFPYGDSAGVSCPFFAERLEPLACLLGTYRTIDSLEFLGKPSPLFAGNVAYGVPYQMHDAALYNDQRENGACPLLKTCDTIHREESDRLYTAHLELIEDLHPCVACFPLR